MNPTDEAISNAAALARCVAAYGLRDLHSFPTEVDEQTWASFVPMVALHRLSGLLVTSIRDGALDVGDSFRADALSMHRAATTTVLGLDGLLLDAVGALTADGVDARVLKGCAHAQLLFDDPGLRPYVDVDLLVRGAQFAAAVKSLEGLGLTRPVAEITSGYDERFGKGATMRTPAGVGLDLHRTFLAGPVAFLIDPESLFDTSETVTVAGSRLCSLGREEALLHACLHSTLSDDVARLISIRDVAEGCLHPATDLSRVFELASSWRVSGVLSAAVAQAWDVLAPARSNWLVLWAQQHRPSRRDRMLLRAYAGHHRRWGRQAAAAAAYVPGLRPKLAYMRSLAMVGIARRRNRH
jgi:hypothetical protein